ncbi:hypothetical protein ACIQMZ_37210 [Streptomyces longwoodensis]|uniref:hypothetical protein n=1 Tax=Streptomyces longwoodensis TaxID=68231 RepID=UPI00381E7BF7
MPRKPDPAERLDHQIHALVNARTHDAIVERAQRQGVSQGHIVRELLTKALAEPDD